jgi:hypothetical protein
VGKVYQYQQTAILVTLARGPVIGPTLTFDTAQVVPPALTASCPSSRAIPTRRRASEAVNSPTAGEAVMSPTCRAFLEGLRNQVLAGGYINNSTTGPTVDGDRRMAAIGRSAPV